MSKELKLKILMIINLILSSLQIDSSNVIIISFSKSGNTQIISDYINKSTKIRLYNIKPKNSYPSSYDETLKIAQNEQNTNARPEIDNPLKDISNYDIILLGYPLWYGHLPNIVITQLELLDLENKEIYPFNTHGSSGISNSVNDIKKYASDANVHNGFPIKGSDAKSGNSNVKTQVNDWLNSSSRMQDFWRNNSTYDIITSHNAGDPSSTYNSFINAGYSSSERVDGVMLFDINS